MVKRQRVKMVACQQGCSRSIDLGGKDHDHLIELDLFIKIKEMGILNNPACQLAKGSLRSKDRDLAS